MKRKIYIITALLFQSLLALAQQFADPVAQSSTGYSGTGANINVVYHRCDWTIDPNSATKTITGTVTTYFKTTQANVSSLSFDLNKTSFNNGSLVVTYHGITCAKSFPSSGLVNILNITLPSTIVAANTLDSIVIAYSGIPPAVSGAAEGYQSGGTGTNKYIMTLAESYEDRDWWPCKADMQDKVDSMDIIVNVPWIVASADTFWVATNGVLVDSTITSATTRRFKFKTRYPIAPYLVCVSVGKFTRYYRYVNINGTNTPIAYYILRNTTNHATKVAAMDQMTPVVLAFGNKFGEYPFKLEKHGFYDGLLGAGGMEHQTFSAIATGSLTSLSTLAHELGHQWFGDNVTFATWNDLWLAEGFARYSEAYAAELVPSLGLNPYTIRNGFKSSALALNAQSAWIPNGSMSNSDLIWNTNYGSTVYERGAMIVSMLRTMSGDAKFSQALTNYQTALAGKSATTDSLRNHFNAVLGVDISEFFKDYVGGSGSAATAVGGVGNPINQVNWNTPVANKLVLTIGTQTRTAGSNVSYFSGPVVVHATNAASGWTKDTTIVFFDWDGNLMSYAGNGISVPNTNFLQYNLSFTPTNLFYDDSARTMSTGTTNKLTTLAANIVDFTAFKGSNGNTVSLSLSKTNPAVKVEVEKSSNGTDFITAGIMNSQTGSSNFADYLFNDAFPYLPVTFYRAKIYYATGEELTGIVKVKTQQSSEVAISPNPVSTEARISFQNPGRSEALVKVVNAAGKSVLETTTNKAFILFNTGRLPAGVYMVSVTINGQVSESSRLVVAH